MSAATLNEWIPILCWMAIGGGILALMGSIVCLWQMHRALPRRGDQGVASGRGCDAGDV